MLRMFSFERAVLTGSAMSHLIQKWIPLFDIVQKKRARSGAHNPDHREGGSFGLSRCVCSADSGDPRSLQQGEERLDRSR